MITVLFDNLKDDLSDLSEMLIWAEARGTAWRVQPGRTAKETWAGIEFDIFTEEEKLIFKLMFGHG